MPFRQEGIIKKGAHRSASPPEVYDFKLSIFVMASMLMPILLLCLKPIGADGRIRTGIARATSSSGWCVCLFHHVGKFYENWCGRGASNPGLDVGNFALFQLNYIRQSK